MKNTKNFASRWGFILASVGSAVGMANVWGFPNKLGSNGGGAFLLIYLLFVFIFSYVGLPAEFAMGRHAATGTLGAYEKAWSTRGKGAGKAGGLLGWLPLAGSLCIAFGYAVIVTYILKALVDSLVGTLMTADTASWFGTFSSTPYSVIPYHIIVVVGTLLTLYLGAHSIEKTNKIMMPLFFIIFLILAVRVAMLPGVSEHSNKRSYHEIRRASDRLCKEHGLSVIVPGRDKGKSYIEHQAAQNGTSYKAKLKAAIDRLIPVSSSLEDLLARLQREGYEIKRGKYISARAPDQERFTRLKTLGADYTEAAVVSRIAGGPRPSRQPQQRSGKVSLLIDIQNNIKAQQSAGYQRWATIENLKRAAATMNFLTEHGIGSYEELVERCDAVAAASIRTRESLRDTEQRIADHALLGKQIDTYRKLKPVYDRYKASKDKEKFLRGFESEIILFEAAAREIKKAGLTKLPSSDKVKAELEGLSARKAALQTELRKIQREEKEYDTLRQNVDALLERPKEQEQQRQRSNDLE